MARSTPMLLWGKSPETAIIATSVYIRSWYIGDCLGLYLDEIPAGLACQINPDGQPRNENIFNFFLYMPIGLPATLGNACRHRRADIAEMKRVTAAIFIKPGQVSNLQRQFNPRQGHYW